MTMKMGLVAALAAVLAGCAAHGDVSVPVRFDHGNAGEQRYIQATTHWQSVASEVAAQLSERAGGRRVTISGTPTSHFGRAFAAALETALVQQGASVANRHGDIDVQVDTQLVIFQNTRTARRLLWSERSEHPSGVGSNRLSGVPSFTTHLPIPGWELSLHIRGTEGDDVVFASHETFYVPENDLQLYQIRASVGVTP